MTVIDTLSSDDNTIEGASVTAKNGSISVSGATLEAVYTMSGQQVGNSNLASGVYIVRISNEGKTDTVKVFVN